MQDNVEPFRPVRSQQVNYTATHGVITNLTGTGINVIRVTTTTIAHIAIGIAPTATTADTYMNANTSEYFIISGPVRVSAIQVASGGTLHVTECSR